MDEDDIYDEFGNYIGPDLNSSQDEYSSSEDEQEDQEDHEDVEDHEDADGSEDTSMMVHGNTTSYIENEDAIVLHEDKQYYPDASTVFGEATVLVMDEDSQPIEQPIIEPVKMKSFSTLEKNIPETKYDTTFMTSLMAFPTLVRNVAIIGSLHHGKTSLLDILIEETHVVAWDPEKEVTIYNYL